MANPHFTFDPEANAAKMEELRGRLAEQNIPLTLGGGCDFHLNVANDNLKQARENPARFSINGLGYLLVEVADYSLPPGLTETFYELQLAGLTPILTHPERNPTLQNDPERMRDWLRGGVLIQVTADSLTGHKGRKAEQHGARAAGKARWVYRSGH